MSAVALKFKYGATTVDFYDDEVQEMEITHVANRTIYSNLYNYYGIYRIGGVGSEYKIFDIDFFIRYGGTSGTLEKLEGLYNQVVNEQPSKLLFYYQYKINPLMNTNVKMIRQRFEWNYFNGEELADYILPLTFVQVHVDVGVLREPFMATGKG